MFQYPEMLMAISKDIYHFFIIFIGPDAQADHCSQGKAKVCIPDFKTKWSELKRPSQTTAGKVKPSYIWLILKLHCQSFIPRVGPKQRRMSAHLGCTCKEGTS